MQRPKSRDISIHWPVVDGPCVGESLASANDDFDVLISADSQRMLVDDPFKPAKRVRYYLRLCENGSYCWSIKST